jgi:hypothetical protein
MGDIGALASEELWLQGQPGADDWLQVQTAVVGAAASPARPVVGQGLVPRAEGASLAGCASRTGRQQLGQPRRWPIAPGQALPGPRGSARPPHQHPCEGASDDDAPPPRARLRRGRTPSTRRPCQNGRCPHPTRRWRRPCGAPALRTTCRQRPRRSSRSSCREVGAPAAPTGLLHCDRRPLPPQLSKPRPPSCCCRFCEHPAWPPRAGQPAAHAAPSSPRAPTATRAGAAQQQQQGPRHTAV